MLVIFYLRLNHYSCTLQIGRLVVTMREYDLDLLSDKVECLFLFNMYLFIIVIFIIQIA